MNTSASSSMKTDDANLLKISRSAFSYSNRQQETLLLRKSLQISRSRVWMTTRDSFGSGFSCRRNIWNISPELWMRNYELANPEEILHSSEFSLNVNQSHIKSKPQSNITLNYTVTNYWIIPLWWGQSEEFNIMLVVIFFYCPIQIFFFFRNSKFISHNFDIFTSIMFLCFNLFFLQLQVYI